MTINTQPVDTAIASLQSALNTRLNNLKTGISETGVFNISIAGNAATATKLAQAIRLNGTNFDGSANSYVPSLYDTNGNPLIYGTTAPNAINYIGVTNASTGNVVSLVATGSDNNIPLSLTSKGLGVLTLQGGSYVDIRPIGGSLRIFNATNNGAWTFNLGASSTSQTLNFPASGNVTLQTGTAASLSQANEYSQPQTFDQPLFVVNAFQAGTTGPGAQQNGFYITEFNSAQGVALNPLNTVAIAAQTSAFRSIALSVDNFGYIWGYTANPNSGIAVFTSKSRQSDSLTQARALGLNGDATGSIGFDGSSDVTIPVVLANTGVTAGTYNNVTVDAKGRAIGGANIAYLTSNQAISLVGDATGTGTTAISVTLADSGVVPGTYNTVTVDSKGRVTVGQDVNYGGTGGTGDTPITITGDVTGSGVGTINLTIANTGVTAGNYTKVSVNSKGQVTSATNLTPVDIPSLDYSKITTGFPTTCAGYGIVDAVRTTDNVMPFSFGQITSIEANYSDVTPSQIFDTFGVSQYRSAEYMIQAAHGTSYQITKILVVQDGVNVFIDEYGGTNTSSPVVTVDASLVGTNVTILITPALAGVTVRAIRTTINA